MSCLVKLFQYIFAVFNRLTHFSCWWVWTQLKSEEKGGFLVQSQVNIDYKFKLTRNRLQTKLSKKIIYVYDNS
jgi:hypothetical protein